MVCFGDAAFLEEARRFGEVFFACLEAARRFGAAFFVLLDAARRLGDAAFFDDFRGRPRGIWISCV